MRWIPKLKALAVASIGLTVATVALAHPPFPRHGPGDGPKHGPQGFVEKYAERLGLDGETRAAIQEIVGKSWERGSDLRTEHHGAVRTLHDLLQREDPDRAVIMEQAERMGGIETELHKHRLGAMLEIHALLTPEQREELVRIREEFMSRRFDRLFDACDEDLAAYCSQAEGPRASAECLLDHSDELSAECRDAMEEMPRRRPGRRGPLGGRPLRP
jgi:Spy/CpxP family protein refolding chaperone